MKELPYRKNDILLTHTQKRILQQLRYRNKSATTPVVPLASAVHHFKNKEVSLFLFLVFIPAFTSILDSNKHTSKKSNMEYLLSFANRKLLWNYHPTLKKCNIFTGKQNKNQRVWVTKAKFNSAIHSLNESLWIYWRSEAWTNQFLRCALTGQPCSLI